MSNMPFSEDSGQNGMSAANAPFDDASLRWWERWDLAGIAAMRSFRLACAIVFIAMHMFAVVRFGRSIDLPFNHAPGEPPYFSNPSLEGPPNLWDRFLISRWDSVHYMALALRGYSTCPPRPVPANYLEIPVQCQLSFFPGYPAIAWLMSFGGRLPIDWVMLGISIAAGVLFLYLWTHEVLRKALGTRVCYMSLLAFNVFPAAFALVTIQTEALVLAATMACFIAVQTRRLTLGALCSGFATGIRITGVGVPIAYAVSILALHWKEGRKVTGGWVVATLARLAISAWGIAVTAGYHYYRFNDPLAYLHSHARAFKHEPSLVSVFFPDWDLVHRSIAAFEHEGVWVGAALLWLALGMRKALAGFDLPARFFWIGLTAATLGIAMPGSVELAYAGMIRYLLLVIPLFFSIAAVGKRSKAAFVLWIALSAWNYYNVTLRFYLTGGPFTTRWSPEMVLPPRPGAPPPPPLPSPPPPSPSP
jgi:hypothetical protein